MNGKKLGFRHKLILLLLILTVIIFVFSISRQKNGINVVVAKADIEADTLIDNNNLDGLFEIRRVDEGFIPKNSVKDKEDMIGKRIMVGIGSNTVMQNGFVDNPDKDSERMKEPVIMGLKVSDMSQMVCGTIRKNDLIDISVINLQSDECIDVLRNVRVEGCYNSDGSIITDDGCATCINISVEKNDEQYINEMLSIGELRICKAGGSSE